MGFVLLVEAAEIGVAIFANRYSLYMRLCA